MREIQQTRDTCVDRLTSTEGELLQIMANLKSPGQATAVVEGYIGFALGSNISMEMIETLLRSSISYNGRGRDDIKEVGKSANDFGAFADRLRVDP